METQQVAECWRRRAAAEVRVRRLRTPHARWSAAVAGGRPEFAHGDDGGRDVAMGVEAGQFGQWSRRWGPRDRAAVGVGAVGEDRDQPEMGLPPCGQQGAPVFRIELDGGMEAAAPGPDINRTRFAPVEPRRELVRRLAQRGGQRIVVFGDSGDGGELRRVAVAIRVLADAEQRADPAERFIGDRANDDGGEKAVEHGQAVGDGGSRTGCTQPAVEFVERHGRTSHAGGGR
ncbi:protein of unknown function (plasmid) [Rhodovastum atsumiense]|nr:protein of unknown function [Rhodovastum atsumiense]